MKTFAACLTAIISSHASVALAQGGRSGSNYHPQTTKGYGVPSGHYGFGAPVAGQIHHSPTYEEGVRRGNAAIIQAKGNTTCSLLWPD